MKNILAITLVLNFLLTGCAVSVVKPSEDSTDVIAFSKEVVLKMSSKVDKLVVPKLHNKEEQGSTYTVFSSKFNPAAGGGWGVTESFKNYCTKIDGEFVYRSACIKKGVSPEEPMFYLRARRVGVYNGIPKITIKVVKPNSVKNIKENKDYLNYIRSIDYLTVAERELIAKQEEEKRLQEARKREQLEKERLARELPMLRTVGTHICKNSSSGYVENVQGEKIQIRVSLYGGKQRIIWDNPEKWQLCK